MKRNVRISYIVLGLAAIAAAAGAARAISTEGGGQGKPDLIYFAKQAQNWPPPVPADDALARVAAQLGGGDIASAALGPAPAGSLRANLPWLHVRVRVPSDQDGSAVRALWATDLLEGAFADMAGATDDQATNVGGAVVTELLPSGRTIDESAGVGDVGHAQQFPNASASPLFVKSAIGATLVSHGLTAVRIDVLTPIGPAPAVVAQTADPAATVHAYRDLLNDLFGTAASPRYEGYYFQLIDSAGDPLVITAAAFRTGTGRTWIAPQWRNQVQGTIQGALFHT
jgi:hypothetical protein